jgi:hypothetical protein
MDLESENGLKNSVEVYAIGELRFWLFIFLDIGL